MLIRSSGWAVSIVSVALMEREADVEITNGKH